MSLDLTDAEKATMLVQSDDGAGNLTDLGIAFHWALDHPVITLTVVGGVIFAVGLAVGSAILHLTALDGSLPLDVDVNVTDSGIEPGVPHLVVTFGTPEPK